MKSIVHQDPDGSIAVTSMSPDYVADCLAAGMTEQQILDDEFEKINHHEDALGRKVAHGYVRLPDHDHEELPPFEHQDCWHWDGGRVAIHLGKFKAKRADELNRARDAAIAAGKDITYKGVVYDGDAKARKAIEDALSIYGRIGKLPDGYTWRAKDNTDHAVTLDDLAQLAAIAAQAAYDHHVRCRSLKSRLDAARSVEAAQAVSW